MATSEDFEYVLNKIDNEGFHYCFKHYSNFEDIKDKKFHTLRKAYLEAAEKLQEYVKQRSEINDLDIDENE